MQKTFTAGKEGNSADLHKSTSFVQAGKKLNREVESKIKIA